MKICIDEPVWNQRDILGQSGASKDSYEKFLQIDGQKSRRHPKAIGWPNMKLASRSGRLGIRRNHGHLLTEYGP